MSKAGIAADVLVLRVIVPRFKLQGTASGNSANQERTCSWSTSGQHAGARLGQGRAGADRAGHLVRASLAQRGAAREKACTGRIIGSTAASYEHLIRTTSHGGRCR